MIYRNCKRKLKRFRLSEVYNIKKKQLGFEFLFQWASPRRSCQILTAHFAAGGQYPELARELLIHFYMKAQDRQSDAGGDERLLEVFEIRSPLSERAAIESKLEVLKCDLLDDDSTESIEFYCHAELPTDWCIQLRYTCDSPGTTGSALGLRILTSLQELGSVYHSIWRELRSSEAPDVEEPRGKGIGKDRTTI